MSHWQKGKLSIKCSTKVLTRALERIFPQWEGHIQVDEGEGLTAYDYVGRKMDETKFSILIPGVKNPNFDPAPGLRYNDLGITRDEDGGWDVHVDNSGLRGINNVENRLKGEIQKMKDEALAKMGIVEGMQTVSEDEDERTVRFWVDRDKFGKLKA